MCKKYCWPVIGVTLLFAAVAILSSCTSTPTKVKPTIVPLRQQTSLDGDWMFHRGDVDTNEPVMATNYDDRKWTVVQVPHDYVLDGAYSTNHARNHGYLPHEPAWYRKHFVIPGSDQGRMLQLQFDGVFRDSQVWLNGKFLGRHESGYTGFYYDITKAAKYGGDNLIVVRTDPREFEGWFYEGGGIYRQVYLNALAPLHVIPNGTYVISKVPNGEKGADAEAEITVQTTVRNDGTAAADCRVISEIYGPEGILIKKLDATGAVSPGCEREINQHTVILHPHLWSLDSPQLYKLRTTILRSGRRVDTTMTTFGIRTIVFDANKGFFLNGKRVEIQGVANHQDFPAVGIAMPDSLQLWRVQKLKAMGCNAWRTAHNMTSESVLDACDRLGMLVMDENRHLGDTYKEKTPAGATATNFADLDFMLRRDRNHPSIIMWSMCNEEHLQGTPEGAGLFSAMMTEAKLYDRTRPITAAMNAGYLKPGIADVEDIVGLNYSVSSFDAVHKLHADKLIFGSEQTNDKTTRGQYVNDSTNGWCSGYNLSENSWLAIVNRPYMGGTFSWTGFDYKGEPNPFGWPDISNNTGLFDCCGFPKDKCYYFESCWSDKPMVHLLPARWNWPGQEGQPIRVIAFSNAREVELFLNGKSLGSQKMPHDGHLEWKVPFAPGTLMAKATTDGNVVATDKLETTGAPASIQISADREILHTGGQDTVVIPVSILDAQGRLVPEANNRVTFELTGGGKLLGVGNGNPSDHDPDRANQRNAFNGHCIAVVQAGSQAGTIQLTATSPGLASTNVTLRIQ